MEESKQIEPTFKKYSSINILNSRSANEDLEYWKQKILANPENKVNIEDIDWVISEKIHGSNFSFIISKDKTITAARRNDLLKSEESFNNHQTIFKEIKEQLLKLLEICQKKYSDENLEQIQVYGELYGGSYPHKDVPASTSAKKVQGCVFYCPQNAFSIFDLTIQKPKPENFEEKKQEEETVKKEGNDDEEENEDTPNASEPYLRRKLVFEEVKTLCEEAGLHFIQPLKIGKYEELSKFDVESFQSVIYKEYDLPLLEKNIAEGVVLRPLNFSQKPIFKIKSTHFSETKDVKETDEDKNKKLKEKQEKQLKEQSENEKNQGLNDDKIKELEGHICENRLQNVISKMTDQEQKAVNKVYAALVKDAEQDFIKVSEENAKWFKGINSSLKGKLKKQLFQQAKSTVDEHYKKQ